MEQWLRDAIAEEQGYIICPLSGETYTICDEKCEKCESYMDFIEALKEREEDKRCNKCGKPIKYGETS